MAACAGFTSRKSSVGHLTAWPKARKIVVARRRVRLSRRKNAEHTKDQPARNSCDVTSHSFPSFGVTIRDGQFAPFYFLTTGLRPAFPGDHSVEHPVLRIERWPRSLQR